MPKIHIAIFASGTGTNAENLFHYFNNHSTIKIGLLVCNKEGALVIEKAIENNIPVQLISKEEWRDEHYTLEMLSAFKTDLIVLAGFLWLVPTFLVQSFPNKILNIHPALLPKYGGKGMYGMKVHESVLQNKEKETGITIHVINENYDEGQIIFQKSCAIMDKDAPHDIATKVHELEYAYLPVVVEDYAVKIIK